MSNSMQNGARSKLESGCASWDALMAKSKTSIVMHVPDSAADGTTFVQILSFLTTYD